MKTVLALSAVFFLIVSFLFFASKLYTPGSIFILTSAVSIVGSSVVEEIRSSIIRLKGDLK